MHTHHMHSIKIHRMFDMSRKCYNVDNIVDNVQLIRLTQQFERGAIPFPQTRSQYREHQGDSQCCENGMQNN